MASRSCLLYASKKSSMILRFVCFIAIHRSLNDYFLYMHASPLLYYSAKDLPLAVTSNARRISSMAFGPIPCNFLTSSRSQVNCTSLRYPAWARALRAGRANLTERSLSGNCPAKPRESDDLTTVSAQNINSSISVALRSE